ncbi:hypothetical protein ACOSQ3_022469 [Xanthoceras sorbifolium]
MTRADDGSLGRSHMMRKSHVRFPKKGVATWQRLPSKAFLKRVPFCLLFRCWGKASGFAFEGEPIKIWVCQIWDSPLKAQLESGFAFKDEPSDQLRWDRFH